MGTEGAKERGRATWRFGVPERGERGSSSSRPWSPNGSNGRDHSFIDSGGMTATCPNSAKSGAPPLGKMKYLGECEDMDQ
jgi:hypothetical protein